MKFIKKLISYFLGRKNNKKIDDLDEIIEDVIKSKDPFIYK
jgi:hypothetical protein